MATTRPGMFSTSVGIKLLIGASGLFLFVYLIVHIGGNLMVFLGPEVFNEYAHVLAGNPLIKVIEVVLLLGFLLHIVKTIQMYLENRGARPVGYAEKKYAGPPSRKTLASSTMILSGLWLLVFLVLHVRTFRFSTMLDYTPGVHDLYRLEMSTLDNPLVAWFYVLSMVVVGSHLWHGVGSSVQSLGLSHSRFTPRFLALGKILAVLIAGGFIVIVLWAHYVVGGRL